MPRALPCLFVLCLGMYMTSLLVHVQQTQSQIASGELQGVADGRSELRCLGGETDTSCSYGVCLLKVPPIALGAWSMDLVLRQPPEYYYYYS